MLTDLQLLQEEILSISNSARFYIIHLLDARCTIKERIIHMFKAKGSRQTGQASPFMFQESFCISPSFTFFTNSVFFRNLYICKPNFINFMFSIKVMIGLISIPSCFIGKSKKWKVPSDHVASKSVRTNTKYPICTLALM